MGAQKKIPRSLQSFIELIDDPALVVDKKLEILYTNKSAKDFLKSKDLSNTKNIGELSFIRNAAGTESFELSKSDVKLVIDQNTTLSIKPLGFKGLYLVSIRSKDLEKNEEKNNWNPMAQIVHDMRTPLAALIGFTRLLGGNSLEETERKYFLERAENNLGYLEGIIAQLLQFTKQQNESIKVEKKIIDSKSFLEGICRDITVVAKNRSLECTYEIHKDIPQKIAIDPNGVRHVVDNLAGNSIKYTPSGKIKLSFSHSAKNNQLIFQVKDSGIGIAPENQAHIFSPFFQESRRDRGGVGLGLSIIKVYSQAMGGDAYLVESQKDKGSTFGAHFDCSIVGELDENLIPDLSQPAASINPVTLQGLKILIVDDSPDIQLLVKRVLTKMGAEVVTSDSPVDALEHIKIGQMDLLISDMQMPEMSGHELLDLARENGYTGAAIALTGLEEQKAIAQSGRHQFSCYLTKPFQFDVLRSMVAELTHSGRS